MTSCAGFTRFYLPNTSPINGVITLTCPSASYCPYLVYQGATPRCCPLANQLQCRDNSCTSKDDCPAVVSSKANVPAPASSSAQVRPSSAVNTPVAATSARSASAPTASGQRTCSGGLVCGNNWFCSVDYPPSCCPKQGQSLCQAAQTCFTQSLGEQCCGNTICYSGQGCAPGGNACIGSSSSSASSKPALSTLISVSTSVSGSVSGSVTRKSAVAIVPTGAATDAPESAALNVLQTAVPQSVQNDPAGACFLDTVYTSYTTPSWYTAMPTSAQSYFASINAQNTAACVANSKSSNGLSDGAKAGIAVGSIAGGVAALGVLAFVLIKTGVIGSGAAAASAPAWSGVTGGEHAWSGVAGSSAHPPPPPPTSEIPPILVAGAVSTNSHGDQNRTSYIPYRPPPGHEAYSNFSSPTAYAPMNQQPSRSVSPPDPYPYPYPNRPEMHDTHRPSEMSDNGAESLRTELSTNGAYPGHEIYSNERFEAPAGNWGHPPGAQDYGPRY